MKLIAELKGSPHLNFEIEEEMYTNVATKERFPQYKIYIYIDGIDTYDYLLETLEDAKQVAFDDYKLPLDAWVQVE